MIFRNFRDFRIKTRENEEKFQKCETEKFLICIIRSDSAGRIACPRWLDMITKKNVSSTNENFQKSLKGELPYVVKSFFLSDKKIKTFHDTDFR